MKASEQQSVGVWLKSVSRYGKVASLRLNQDDDRRVALNASPKRYATAERIVADTPGVTFVEALDGTGAVMSTYVVKSSAPSSSAAPEPEVANHDALLAQIARHIRDAFREGAETASKPYTETLQEFRSLYEMQSSRVEKLEAAWIRSLNQQARALEDAAAAQDDGGEGPGGILGTVLSLKAAELQAQVAGKKPA